jgi:hypothetical protein
MTKYYSLRIEDSPQPAALQARTIDLQLLQLSEPSASPHPLLKSVHYGEM